jgi:hypothetical protein
MRPRARRFIGGWMLLPFVFFALSLSAQTPANLLPPLSPPDGEIQPTFWERHGTTILIAAIEYIALAGVITWIILRPKPARIVPPNVWAREALTRLLPQPEDGNVLSEISQVLRRYISVAFKFPSAEMTTAEFSAALAGNKNIGAELGQAIASFLRECDERKFSRVNPTAPVNAARRALKLIEQAEQRRICGSGSVPNAAAGQPPPLPVSSPAAQKPDVARPGEGRASP